MALIVFGVAMLGCKKEHPIDLDWNLKYQRKDRAKTIHPYPWRIVGYYYPPDPNAQNWYNLTDAGGGKLNCIDRDLEEYYGK